MRSCRTSGGGCRGGRCTFARRRWAPSVASVRSTAPAPTSRSACPRRGSTTRSSAARLHEDLAGLPEKLAHVEELAAAGVIGGAQPNAADLQIGATMRVLLALGDLRPLIAGSAGERIARECFPGVPRGRARRRLPGRLDPGGLSARREDRIGSRTQANSASTDTSIRRPARLACARRRLSAGRVIVNRPAPLGQKPRRLAVAVGVVAAARAVVVARRDVHVQPPPRPRERDVEQPPLLGDPLLADVLMSAGKLPS